MRRWSTTAVASIAEHSLPWQRYFGSGCVCHQAIPPPANIPTSTCFCHALDRYQCPKLLLPLRKLHSQLISRGLHLDPSVSIKLMRSYCACGEAMAARQVFDETPERNIVFFNVMLRGYTNNGMYEDGVHMFCSMGRFGVGPDNYTLPCVLKSCAESANLLAGVQVHSVAVKHGLDTNFFVENAMISMYARCRCLDEAHRLFDRIPYRKVVSWNAIIAGYVSEGKFDHALDICREMVEAQNVRIDAGTMASILPAVLNTNPDHMLFVKKMFDEMRYKGLVSWNAMVAMYVGHGMTTNALDMFSKMTSEGIEPDVVTLAIVLPACGDLSALIMGNKIHAYIKRKGMCANLLLGNALIDMYAKCGSLLSSRKVFDAMLERDVVSWTSLISAYGMNGFGREAISLFKQMRLSGLKPDNIAFVSILSACSHSGLVKEGYHYFQLMTNQYQIVPTIEHYTCMVDLFARSGNLREAVAFVQKMLAEPNEKIWGTLLSACHVYSNINVGVTVADQLFKLVPEQPGYYVLLSNMYAKAGRWADVSSVRNIMKSKGLKKIAGCSNVEFNSKVYTFLAGDRSHPQTEEIYAELELLLGRMRELGYMPEVDSALHDVEDEDKQGHLTVHSEKLAIVFALINTNPGVTVRITKNLRVCGDCHTAAKLISKLSERVIILRDNSRFHYFDGGICSCGDYW